MIQKAEGFNDQLQPIQTDPKKKIALAPGFGQNAAMPAPLEQATPSKQYAENYIAGSSLKDYIAGQQGAWDQLGNMLEQSVVGALTGTVETASYILDLQQHWDKLHGDEEEYKNSIGEAMKKLKEENREQFPIYLSEENEGFNPTSGEWWAHHGGEGIGTVLGLMVPGMAVAKLGKLAGMGRLGQTASATIASRTAESTMEANGVYEEAFKALVDQGVPENEARRRAGEQASNAWNTNWVFAVQDLAQFNAITKGFGVAAKGGVGQSIKQLLKQSVSEGAEEAGQYVVSQEAINAAKDVNVDYFGEGFNKRLSDYIDDDEFWTSTVLGAAGGAVFQLAGTAGESLTKEVKQGDLLNRTATKVKNMVKRGVQKVTANTVDDLATTQVASNIDFTQSLVDNLNKGKLAQFKLDLEEAKKETGLPSEARQMLEDSLADTEELLTEEARLKSSNVPQDVHKDVLLRKLEQRQNVRLAKQIENDLNKTEQELIKYQEIPQEYLSLKKLELAVNAYEKLAKLQPQFAAKATQLRSQLEIEKNTITPGLQLAGLTADKVLSTSKDERLNELTFQLVATKEKQTVLQSELKELVTPEGIAKQKKVKEQKLVAEQVSKAITDPSVTVPQLTELLKRTDNEQLRSLLTNKITELNNQTKAVNKEQLSQLTEEATTVPEQLEIDFGLPEVDESEPEIDESAFEEQVIDESVPEIAEMMSAESQQKWFGLSKPDVDKILETAEIEQTPTLKVKQNEAAIAQRKAVETIRDKSEVSTAGLDLNSSNEQTVYTNKTTGEKIPANKRFATDKNGNLLVNTPIIGAGTKVILKVENDDQWVINTNFKPDLTPTSSNQIINVYVEGITQPITQLRNSDNKYMSEAQKKINKTLREQVYKTGTLETTITSKNQGSFRKSSVLNSLDILQFDYIQDPVTKEWRMDSTPWMSPPLAVIDNNGFVKLEDYRVQAIPGMTDEVVTKMEEALFFAETTADENNPAVNVLQKMAGKSVTFRTAPDGSMRVVSLEGRLLTQSEINWVEENISGLVRSGDLETLGEVLNITTLSPGVLSTKKGKPSLLSQSTRKFYLIGDKTPDLAIPIAQGWAIIPFDQLDNFFTSKNFKFSFLNSKGRSERQDSNFSDKIITNYRHILKNQFRNIPKQHLNTNIGFTDVANPAVPYTNYYDFLTKTDTLRTDLAGSTTMGYGKDSSYSFEQASIYLDPNPQQSVFKEEESIVTSISTPIDLPKQVATTTAKSKEERLAARFGKLKPVRLPSGYQFKQITEQELDWFKNNIGSEFLQIAKNVDSFIAANGLEAWGQYYNAVVTIADHAIEGTAYHEAIHFFADPQNQLVSPKEAELINKIDEEKLAEQFEAYKISNGKIKPESSEVRGFFKKLMLLIRKLLGFKGPIEKLFEKIDRTVLTEEQKQRIRNREPLFGSSPKLKKLPGFADPREEREAVFSFATEVMRLANEASREKGVRIDKIFKEKDAHKVFTDKVKEMFMNDMNRIKALPEDQRTTNDLDRLDSYEGMFMTYEDPTGPVGFKEDGFLSKVLRTLSEWGVTVKLADGTDYSKLEEDGESIQDVLEEQREEDENERLFDVDHLRVDVSTSAQLKMFLSQIGEPEIIDGKSTGETVKTIFGTVKPIGFTAVHNSLKIKLADSVNVYARLEQLAKNDPISNVVLEALTNELNKGNVQLFNKFITSYNLNHYQKITVLEQTKRTVEPRTGEVSYEYDTRVVNTDQGSIDKVLLNRWREEGVRKNIVESDGSVRPDSAKKKVLAERMKALNTSYPLKGNYTFEQLKDSFVVSLKELGVVVNPQVWSEYDSLKEPVKKDRLRKLIFGSKNRSFEFLVNKYVVDNENPYGGSNVLTELARKSAPYETNLSSGSYTNEKGDKEFAYNLPSTMTELDTIMSNDDLAKEYVKKLQQDPFFKGNFLLSEIISNIGSKLRLTSAIRINDNDPKGFEDRTEIDSTLLRFGLYENQGADSANILTGTVSDKTKQFTIKVKKYKKEQSRNFVKSVFENTIDNEIVRIKRLKAYKEYRKNNPGYNDVLPNDIKNLAGAEKFLYLPELNSIPNINLLTENISEGDVNYKEWVKVRNQASAEIDTFINKEYGIFLDWLIENDVITRDAKGTLQNKRIPKSIITPAQPLASFLTEFFFNDFGWRTEMSKVLMGDRGLYKDDDDYYKRQYQLATPGYKGYFTTNPTLTRLVYKENVKTNTEEKLVELAGLILGDKEKAKQIANKYKDVNKTDAQSLMDIDSYRTLADSLGLWSKEAEEVYQVAWSKGWTINQAIKELSKLELLDEVGAKRLKTLAAEVLLQPFKPFQFNDKEITLPDNSVMIIKQQFKDSITPLTPELANTSEGLRNLLSYMKANGFNIASAADTLKVGSYGVVDLTGPVATWPTLSKSDWRKMRVKATDFRFPQIMPDKSKTETSGTQLHKLMLGNISLDGKYGSKGMLGSTVIEKFNQLWEEKLEQSFKELQSELGIGKDMLLSNEPAQRVLQMKKLQSLLQKELDTRDLNENYRDILDLIRKHTEEVEFGVPLSFPAYGKKFQSILTNLFKKRVIAQKSAGFSAINLADFGVGFNDELKFMAKDTSGEVYTEIGMPIDFLKDIGLKYGEHIVGSKILWNALSTEQQEALQFIAYRIPTSNKSSMLPVRVTRITPKHLNNIIQIPGELTIQMGLDFDVDKTQLLRRVLTKDGKIDEDNVDTKLFNLYWDVLNNPLHIGEVLTPLTTSSLESIYKSYKDLGLYDNTSKAHFLSFVTDVNTEVKFKDGKREIGINSRFNTGHAVMQTIKKYISSKVSINIVDEVNKNYLYNELGRYEDVTGRLISENLAETQQAALDNAKTPLLALMNIVQGTMATAETMLMYGVRDKVVTDMFMQKVIVEWTKLFKQENSNDRKATERLFEKYPQIGRQYNLLKETTQPLSAKALEDNLKTPVGQAVEHDARVLIEFLKVKDVANQLTKINNVLSIDTFQDATGIESLESLSQQVKDATNPDKVVSLDQRLFRLDQTPVEGRRIAAFYEYGIKNALRYVGQFYPSAKFPYRSVRNSLAQALGKNSITDKNLIRLLNQHLDFQLFNGNSMLYTKLTVNHPLYSSNPIEDKSENKYRWKLFDPKFTMADYINSMTTKYPLLAQNDMIKSLATQEAKKDRVQIVGVRNTDSRTNKSEITRGWEELLSASNPEIKALGHDLIKYSIVTSGFKYSTKTFFDLIPISFWQETGIGQLWSDLTDSNQKFDEDAAITNFIRHEFRNIKGFPEVYTRDFLSSNKTGRTHISDFVLKEQSFEKYGNPQWVRIFDNDLNNYRLYEGKGPQFREVQPLGETYFTELSGDGRAYSMNPANGLKSTAFGKPSPWVETDKVTTQSHPLFDYSDPSSLSNVYVELYLPQDKVDVVNVLDQLIKEETDTEAKKNLEVLRRNVDKIKAPIVKEQLTGKLGVFEVEENGDAVIKINPTANIESEFQMRHVLLHEINHAYSVGVIQNPTGENQVNFVRNIDRLRKDAAVKLKNIQGTENNYEFIAELASSKEFRSKLRGTDLWSRLLRNFRKLFNMSDKYDKLLDQYYTILDEAQDLQAISKGEFALKEKKVGTKNPTPLDRLKANIENRIKSLKNKKMPKEDVDKLQKWYDGLKKMEWHQQVVVYADTVSKEMEQLKKVYQTLAKDPSKASAAIVQPIMEQLGSYELLSVFRRMIARHPMEFVPEGGDPSQLIEEINKLTSDIDRMKESFTNISKDIVTEWVYQNKNNPNLTKDQIRDEIEMADRDLTWTSSMLDVGKEMRDLVVSTANRVIGKVYPQAWRKTQADLYTQEATKVKAKIEFTVATKNEERPFTTVRFDINYTKRGRLGVLSRYEAWRGKATTFTDKFAPVLDTNSLAENEDGIQFIAPWSQKGKDILAIKEGSADYPLKEFYENYVLDYLVAQNNIPKSLRPGLRIPTIGKKTMEIITTGENVLSQLTENLHNEIRRRYDETDYYSVDAQGNKQDYIPTRFVAKQDGKDGRLATREVSLDIATTTTLFSTEMYTRKGMEEIVNDLELAKNVLATRKVKANTKVMDLPGIEGLLVSEREGNVLESGEFESIPGIQSKSYQAMDTLLRRQVYGQLKKEEGTFTKGQNKYSVSKIVDALLKYSGFNIMFGNVAIPLTNTIVGKLTMFKEAIGGNLINNQDLLAGEKLYKEAALASIKDLGRREKTTKFGRVFDFLNPFEHAQLRDLGLETTYAKTVLSKILTSGGSASEYYLSTTTLGAVMNKFGATNTKNEKVNLYEALEVKKDGTINLASGYKFNGKSSMNTEDFDMIKDYTLRLYQNVNGVNNMLDKPPVQEYAIGRLGTFMRSWLMPGINTRWRTKFYDDRLKQDVEGHYVSALVAFNNIFNTKDGYVTKTLDTVKLLTWFGTTNPELLLTSKERTLSSEQQEEIINMRKANIRKTLFELYLMVGLTALLAFGWDEDDDDSYAKYMVARARRELLAFVSPSTAWDVLKSPTVAMNMIDGWNKLIYTGLDAGGSILTGEELPVYERGPGKGNVKFYWELGKQTGLGSVLGQFEDIETKTRLAREGRRN